MIDELFSVLADSHRRQLLVALLEHNPQDDVDISEDIYEGDEALEMLQAKMYHIHLPKLEEAGFIRWQQDTHEVIKGPRFEEIRPLLELINNHADELPADWP